MLHHACTLFVYRVCVCSNLASSTSWNSFPRPGTRAMFLVFVSIPDVLTGRVMPHHACMIFVYIVCVLTYCPQRNGTVFFFPTPFQFFRVWSTSWWYFFSIKQIQLMPNTFTAWYTKIAIGLLGPVCLPSLSLIRLLD